MSRYGEPQSAEEAEAMAQVEADEDAANEAAASSAAQVEAEANAEPWHIQSEHFTDADIKEMVEQAVKQDIKAFPCVREVIDKFPELFLFMLETAWEAGYEARIEEAK